MGLLMCIKHHFLLMALLMCKKRLQIRSPKGGIESGPGRNSDCRYSKHTARGALTHGYARMGRDGQHDVFIPS